MRDENRQVFSFFVLEGSEKSAIGVDESVGGDVMKSDGRTSSEIKAAE